MNYYTRMAQFSYRLAFVAAMLTYGIVVYKTLRARAKAGMKFSPQVAISLIGDENVQYFRALSPDMRRCKPVMASPLLAHAANSSFSRTVLAFVWLLAPQYPIALLPYSVYSIFHFATYTRSTVIPTIIPPTQAAPAAGASPSAKPQYNTHPIADAIGSFVKEYYDTSMSVVSGLEIALWGRLLLSAILFQRRSWILLAIYTAFLRARVNNSTHVQGSFARLEARVDNLVGAQGTPPAARQIWDAVKGSARTFHSATDLSKYANGAAVPKKTS